MRSKILITLFLILLMLILPISTKSFARYVYTPIELEEKIDTSGTELKNVKSAGGKIVGIIRVVGTITAFGMILVLGIKFMMGSAEQRAEYKKTLLPYLIGAVMVFGCSNITQVIFDLSQKTIEGNAKEAIEIIQSVDDVSLLTDEQLSYCLRALEGEEQEKYKRYRDLLSEEWDNRFKYDPDLQ